MPNTSYNFEFVALPLSRIHKELKSGEIDMIAMTAPDKIREGIILGENFFYQSKNYLITRKDFKYNKITTIDQLKNVVIGSKKDGSRIPFFANNMHKLVFENSTNIDSVYTGVKKLFAGRVDALYAYTYISLLYVIKKDGSLNKIKLVEIPGETVKVYAGYSSKLDKKIRDKIENQIYIQIHDKKFDLDKLISSCCNEVLT
jgi:hypothetical protein